MIFVLNYVGPWQSSVKMQPHQTNKKPKLAVFRPGNLEHGNSQLCCGWRLYSLKGLRRGVLTLKPLYEMQYNWSLFGTITKRNISAKDITILWLYFFEQTTIYILVFITPGRLVETWDREFKMFKTEFYIYFHIWDLFFNKNLVFHSLSSI